MNWRLVDSDLQEPAYTVAADEAMTMARSKDIVPNTLHFYRRKHPTVSLGYFQKADIVLNLEFCKENDIQIVRRTTGGSAIYTDSNHLIYGLAVNEETLPGSREQTFKKVCSAIVLGLEYMGVKAVFKPVNDVLVDGRKISGSAQMRRWGIILQHGTLILRNEPEMMLGALKMDMQKVKERGLKPATYATSLAEVMDEPPAIVNVKKALESSFERIFDISLVRTDFSMYEKDKIEELVRTKYGLEEWNLRL
ncbi:MAG: biotin/lipoate A/B protein ligase family protein [Thermoplasmata archaeon]|nr:biotin/lipoate A/B protein ligase family protein [Thermoplasmata archaeon]